MSDRTLRPESPDAPPWVDHAENPFNWPERKKWRIFFAAASVTFLAGLNATAIATPGPEIAERFHVSDGSFPNSFWPVTAWTTAAALGPMVGMPMFENFGIRTGYLIVYALFTLLIIPQAVAPNFATLLVTRAIAGALGGILQNAPEPFLADTWLTDEERNLPITVFVLVYEAGVTLGPTFGAIASKLGWRWVSYLQLIIFGAFFPFLLLVIKETRGTVILARRAKQDTRLSRAASEAKQPPLSTLFYEAIARPAHLLCTEPVVFFLTLWSAFCFGIVFISTQSIPQIYSINYGFTDAESGLVQVALLVGEVIGFFACLPQNTYYQRSAARNPINPGIPIPEARLPLSIPASLVGLAGGLFWYAWASYPFLHWILPTVGLVFIGFSVMVIVTAVIMYLTDAYAKYAGSAVAAVAFGENIFAAWLPLATRRMYTVLGFQWASSVLGFVALALTLAPIVLLLKGENIRKKSKFIKEASYL
ncbi:MAG: hypothetical protein M1837_004126 [Sclerophora amabilis]|nr:MAG: hypothetical protein M1837_004126 [Sclerophora amabilis]